MPATSEVMGGGVVFWRAAHPVSQGAQLVGYLKLATLFCVCFPLPVNRFNSFANRALLPILIRALKVNVTTCLHA